MSDEGETQSVQVGSEPVIVRTLRWHREGTNDYKNGGVEIVRILTRDETIVEPVWKEDWIQIAPGIESGLDGKLPALRIHRSACPVRVLMRDWSEYVSYTDSSHNTSGAEDYWVRHEAAASES